MNHNKLPKLKLGCVSWPEGGQAWFKGMRGILILFAALPMLQAGEPVEPMRRIGGSAPIQNDPTVPGSKFEGMRRVGGTQPWERETNQRREDQIKPNYPSRTAYYEESQPERQATSDQRMASLDVMRAYGELARRVPAHLLSEVSCYMPDYLDEWFVNGRRMPGAPFPSQYCWNRFHADVNAGKKTPLYMRAIENSQKAREEFFKSNPGTRPDPIPEKEKINGQAGKTNAATESADSGKEPQKEDEK